MSDPSSRRGVTTHLQMPWRTATWIALLIAIGLLVALVVVATRVDADSLATTALTLSVIAFGAQLIVYVAQTADSSESRRQASAVNADTRVSLAKIGTTVANSDTLLRDHYGIILNELIENLRRAGIERKDTSRSMNYGDALEVLEDMAVEVNSPILQFSRQAAGAPSDSSPGKTIRNTLRQTAEGRSEIDMWPGEEEMAEVADVYETLKTLDPLAIGIITRFANDWKMSEQLNAEPGLVYAGAEEAPMTASLIEKGLIEETEHYPDIHWPKAKTRPVYAVLTEKGRLAARLMLPSGTAPRHVRDFVIGIANKSAKPDD